MKTLLTTLTMMLLISLLAVGAYAQDGTPNETPKQQTQNYDDANGIDAHGGINRNGDEYAGEGIAHGPVGPGPDEDSAEKG